MEYESLNFKIPVEAIDYPECSAFVIAHIEAIMKDAVDAGKNKIIINTNLRLGLPMENINKIAGPFVEAWAVETFHAVSEIPGKPGHKQLSVCGSNCESVIVLHVDWWFVRRY